VRSMTETLFLECPNCSAQFLSGVQIPRASFEGVTVDGSEQACPSCGTEVLLTADTAFFREE
jgi:ribosomal protein S27AE